MNKKDEIDYSGCVVLPYVKEIDRKLKSICNKLSLRLLYHKKVTLGNLLAPSRPSQDPKNKKWVASHEAIEINQ